MFPFLPRKVAKAAKLAAGSKSSSSVPPPQPSHAVPESSPNPPTSNANKAKEKASPGGLSEEDYAILVSLSLSEHSIWADPDLRRTMDSGEEGYIPLGYLLRHSQFLVGCVPQPTETVLVRSIRTHANDYLDVRMLVSAPSRAMWYGQDSADADELGGYEVRRRDWEDALRRSRNCSRNEWETRTAYMENIPIQYRTIPGIHRFATSLLSGFSPGVLHVVQSISLPPHYQDRLGVQPKCKGFALVTLGSSEHVDTLLSIWPWYPRRTNTTDVDIAGAREAVKFGFRTLTKSRWDALKEEYLAYRQRLLDEIAHAEGAAAQVGTTSRIHARSPSPPVCAAASAAPAASALIIDRSAPYPLGCLVYVRNVHSETNKTTLRTFFSKAFAQHTEGIDYVDFNKGMDTCYLRLATPQHTSLLVDFFESHPTAQLQGLDNTGTPTASAKQAKALALEVVDGTREELYWTKVPEKVRRQAVEKAVVQSTRFADPNAVAQSPPTEPSEKHKRKRRKRDE